MHFTIEDYRKIERWLKENSVKDTEFPETSDLYLNEYLTIIQQGINKKVKLNSLLEFILNNTDSDLDIASTNPVQNQAVTKAIYELQNRNIIKIVDTLPSIDVAESSVIYILLADIGADNNIFTEWIKVNNTWEKVGEVNAEIDLSPYLKIQDAPFEKGISENSAVLKGGNNIAVLKGWYYKDIFRLDTNTIMVTLSNEQKICIVDESIDNHIDEPDQSLPNLAELLGVGTIVSLVNDAKYDNKFKITGGQNGVVGLETVDGSAIPFNVIKAEAINDPEDYSVYCLSQPDKGMFDMGQGSIAVGYNNKATNGKATAFGFNNHAYGKFSFTEGRDNEAGYAAHAEGRGNKAIGGHSHVEGEENEALSFNSHAEGYGTKAGNFDTFPTKGSEKDEVGRYTHSEGRRTAAKGSGAHAEGHLTVAIGKNCHAEGEGTIAKGRTSHSSGYNTLALANYSHTEGHGFRKFDPAYVENLGKISDIKNDIEADWDDKLARNIQSATEGRFGATLGECSHIEGITCITLGNYAHAEGEATKAKGRASHTEGEQTVAKNRGEHACGRFNDSTESTDKAKATQFSIGIGTSKDDRKNGFEVKQNGDTYLCIGGKLYFVTPITDDELNELFND